MLHDINCCWKAREELWRWWPSTFCDKLGVGPLLRLDEGLVCCLLIKRDEADSFEQRKHCEKELKLPEMTRKHWCRTSKSPAETQFQVSATSWEVLCKWVNTDLTLFLQSKFFADPAANLPSMPFPFRFQNYLSTPLTLRRDASKRLPFSTLFSMSGWNCASKFSMAKQSHWLVKIVGLDLNGGSRLNLLNLLIGIKY